MKKRIFTLLLAGLMAAGMVSCNEQADTGSSTGGSTETTESSAAEETADTGEITKLQMLSLPANFSGVLEGWAGDVLAQEVGVEIELLPAGDQGEQKLQAMMASGELCDLVVFKDTKQIENAIAGDMLLPLDDYQDRMADVYANVPEAVDYSKEYLSNGTNSLYALPLSIKTSPEVAGNTNAAPLIRYDLYKEIGAPDINQMEDLLDILKQMQDLEPTNEDGQKVYGLSIWADWDRAYMATAGFAGKNVGVTMPGEGYPIEIHNNEDNKVYSITDENSFYMRFLKFYYDANQLGILDPDSMTQRFDDAVDKTASGRVLMMYDGWGTGNFSTAERENQNIGFARVPMVGETAVQDSLQPVGKEWRISVGKSTEHADKCADFLNYIYSFEGAMTVINGPRGVIWDINEENKPYILEEGYSYLLDPEKELPGGMPLSKGLGLMNCNAYVGAEIDTDYDTPLGNEYWEKPDYAPEDTELVKTWQADYGAKDLLTYLNQIDAVTIAPFAPTPTMTDEMELISSRVGDVINTMSWQMIYAKDEAEFNALKEEMISKAEGLGINDFLEWFQTEYEAALEFGKQYTE